MEILFTLVTLILFLVIYAKNRKIGKLNHSLEIMYESIDEVSIGRSSATKLKVLKILESHVKSAPINSTVQLKLIEVSEELIKIKC